MVALLNPILFVLRDLFEVDIYQLWLFLCQGRVVSALTVLWASLVSDVVIGRVTSLQHLISFLLDDSGLLQVFPSTWLFL